jgi:hypothetical protein
MSLALFFLSWLCSATFDESSSDQPDVAGMM